MKVAIYARYSSDNQRDASITDQMRVCRSFAERQGWTIAQEYSDHAVSGATLLRSGFQALMRDALNRRFDVVLAESLDRFSRDQEDTAGLFKRLTFAGVTRRTTSATRRLPINCVCAAPLQSGRAGRSARSTRTAPCQERHCCAQADRP